MTERPDLARRLDLAPHPEGGWYRRTWTSELTVEPTGYSDPRPTATAIYYVLGAAEESGWHRVRSEELWLHHAGGPLLLRLGGNGDAPSDAPDTWILSGDLAAGHQPQVLVPAGHWQSARPLTGSDVLVTCVVSPGFDFADFTLHQAG